MPVKYTLINPHIEGNFPKILSGKNSNDAADKFYNQMAGHWNNPVIDFMFTIQKGTKGNGKYSHFRVKERLEQHSSSNKDQVNNVNYTIQNITNLPENNMTEFINKRQKFLDSINQAGGKKKHKKHKKKHDDSESSESSTSSSDTEHIYNKIKKYIPTNQPIYYWWYDPYIYNLSSVYVPTFYSYVKPYIEISLTPTTTTLIY